MFFTIEPLPFAPAALSPTISAETIRVHYEKHHRGYVAALNKLVEAGDVQESTLMELILKSKGSIFNNASQVWNHTLYWHSLSPKRTTINNAVLLGLVEAQFGSFEGLLKAMSETAEAFFGSGWLWLSISSTDTLRVEALPNAENPLTRSLFPLLTIDLWEHAYYLDYKNERPRYIESILHCVNWTNASHRFETRPSKAQLQDKLLLLSVTELPQPPAPH